jgi:M6 family metalloprotease-like protein
MKKILLITILIGLGMATYAIPARPTPITVTQPDGTEFVMYLNGDEHFHYSTSEDGLLIVKNTTGYYNYGLMNKKGEISASEFIYHKPENRLKNEKIFIESILKNIDFRNIAQNISIEKSNARMQKINADKVPSSVSSVGEKGIAILVNFSDKAFVTTNTNQKFYNLLNKNGYSDNNAIGSARDYFIACSDSIFQPTFDVYGPYTLPNNMNYYGSNNSLGEDMHPEQMIKDACVQANNNGVDFSQYDTNGDGYVDNVFVFYAGYSEASGGDANTIWPHRYYVSGSNTSFDGVKIRDYACGSELKGNSGNEMDGIGTFSHEFSHVLGLPDMYNTATGNSTLYYWDIMDGGCYNGPGYEGDVPCFYSAYEKFFVGWLTPTLITNCGDYTLNPLFSEDGNAFLVTQSGNHNLNGKNPSPAEFYMLENRQKTSWDYYLPSEGMLIWLINYSASVWESNLVNNSILRVNLIRADRNSSSTTLSGDAFPGNNNQYTTYNLTSNNGAQWNKCVEKITKNSNLIDFHFNCNTLSKSNTKGKGKVEIIYSGDDTWKANLDSGNYVVNVYDVSGRLVLEQCFGDCKQKGLSEEIIVKAKLIPGMFYIFAIKDLNNDANYFGKVIAF